MADAKQQQAVAPSAVWMTVKPFVNGGASGMLATCVIQPIDMVKVRPPALLFAPAAPLGLGFSGRYVRWMGWLWARYWLLRCCGLWAGSCCCNSGFEILNGVSVEESCLMDCVGG